MTLADRRPPLHTAPGFETWRAAAEDVAAALAKDAVERDRVGADPVAEINLLRSSGLLAMYVPSRLGGGGASFTDVLTVVRILAAADGSIAQLALYHFLGTQIGFSGDNRQLAERRAREFVEKNLFDAAVSQTSFGPPVSASPDGGGFRLNGSKPFTSGAAVADSIVVWARFAEGSVIEGRDVSGHLGLFALRLPARGVEFGHDWDNMGQRLTVSGTTTLRDVYITASDLFFHRSPDSAPTPRESLFVPSGQLGFSNLYLGMAVGCLEEAASYTRNRSRPWPTSGYGKASQDPLVIERFGRLSVLVESAAALADRAADVLEWAIGRGDELTEEERGYAAVTAYQSKVHSDEAALEVTSRVFEVTGARSTARSFGLDRYWRNVRTHTLHDPKHLKLLEIGDFFLNGRPPRPSDYS